MRAAAADLFNLPARPPARELEVTGAFIAIGHDHAILDAIAITNARTLLAHPTPT
ncbi:MAG: hypothetical protein ACTHMY_19795 [Solirubrobacteraceae bacterium]